MQLPAARRLAPALAFLALFASGGPASAGSPDGFYAEGNPFLPVVEPIVRGEARFVERLRASAGGGEPFGLVLSGGSARAFAHVGVLEVLEEAGLRPDYLVADSMGAIVALLYGAGMAPADILALLEAYPATELFDPELPLSGGFLDAGRFTAMVRALLGGADLADFPIPVMVACEDLLSRRQVLIAEGEAATVMAASFALPAIFEPVPSGGALLIDGGVTSLVPVEIAYRYGSRVAAATALYAREMDFSSPFVVINRALDIGKTRNSIASMLEARPVVIRCEVEDLSYMQFSRPAEVAARGRESARRALPALLELSSPREAGAALAARRESCRRRVEELAAARRLGGYLGAPRDLVARTRLRLLDEAAGGSEAFAGRRFAGLEAELRGGPATLALSALAGLEGRTDRAWGAGLRASLAGHVFPRGSGSGLAWEFGGEALLSGSASLGAEPSGWAPVPRALAAAAGARAAFGLARGLDLAPEARAELELGLPDGATAWRASAGLGLSASLGALRDIDIGAGLALDSEGNLGPEARLALGAEPGGIAALRLEGRLRSSLEGPGLGPSAAEPGRGPALGDRAALRTLSCAEAAWIARPLEASFGELVIIERPELGAYTELATAGDRYRLTLGACASAGLSALGLAPAVVSAFAGLATDGSGWALGLRAGRALGR